MSGDFELGFGVIHDYVGVENSTFSCFLHASCMVLCIRAEFSDISTGCKNSFSGPGSNGVRARVRSYRKDIKPLFKPKVSSSYEAAAAACSSFTAKPNMTKTPVHKKTHLHKTSVGCAVAADPHADMRLLDHAHVVGAVADRQRHGRQLVLHHTHDVAFLLGRDAAADHGGAAVAQLHEAELRARLLLFKLRGVACLRNNMW